MLPKAHVTLHSRMSSSRSHHEYLFCIVLLCILATSSSYLLVLLGPYHFCPVFVPIFAWNIRLVSLIFLKRSLIFLILLLSSISLHWSLRKAFLSLHDILWNSAFKWVYLSFSPLPLASLLFLDICKVSELFVRYSYLMGIRVYKSVIRQISFKKLIIDFCSSLDYFFSSPRSFQGNKLNHWFSTSSLL